MNTMIHPAYYHHAYYGHHAATGWTGHMIVSSLVHGLVYGLVFKVMRSLSLPEAIVLVGLVLVTIYWVARRRDRVG